MRETSYFDLMREGAVFSRWTIIGRAPDHKSGMVCYSCVCSCGTRRDVMSRPLRTGKSKSCGCYHTDRLTTHGGASRIGERAPEYAIWRTIKSRCQNASHKSFADYGGRGIIVCDRWARSFEDFLADVGPRPSKRHQIDRIDSNGHYEPGNCHWATPIEQANNRRNTIYVRIDGEKVPLATAARKFGVNIATARERLKRGWSDEKAMGIE